MNCEVFLFSFVNKTTPKPKNHCINKLRLFLVADTCQNIEKHFLGPVVRKVNGAIHRLAIFQTSQNCSFTGISLFKVQYF